MSERDTHFMQRALALAAQAEGRTHPNPMVGAVVVRGGRVVGEGLHQRAGTPHAEVHALRAAGARARGADLYVTLEPCCHHGRTPPCVDAIIAAGIRRVIYAMRDPNPIVAGRGLAHLRAAGLAVRGPICAAAAQRLNRAYCHWRATGQPYVVLKVASTLDGALADRTGASQWITNAAVRQYTHTWRARVDAIVVGPRTVVRDAPRLTVRLPGYRGPQPTPMLWIGDGRIPWNAQLLQDKRRPAWIVVTQASAATAARAIRAGHVLIEARDVPDGLAQLGRLGVSSLMLEGGAVTIGAFLRAQAVHYAIVGTAPIMLGRAAVTWTGPFDAHLRHPARIEVERVQQFDDNVVIEGPVTY